jgi:signal transduction histidine kinase/ligand-binding sensor domain-containing protein
MRFLLIVILALVYVNLADAQVNPFDPSKPLSDLSITQWTAEDGLSSNNTTSVFQSSEGLLWITSFNGFMTFDGERFETYDRNTLSFLETDGFYSVIESNKIIYIASQGSGLIQYKEGVFSSYQPAFGKMPKSIRSLLKTRSGEIIIGGSNAGLFRMKRDSIHEVQHADLKGATVMALLEDNEGTIWIATDGNGLFSLTGQTLRHYTRQDGLTSNSVEGLALSPEGILFAGTERGMLSYRSEDHFVRYPETENYHINALWVDEWSTVWIGTEKGLLRYNLKQPKPELLLSKNNIDFVRVTDIVKDKEENLWLTSNRSGLIRLKETNITNIQTPLISSKRVNIVKEGLRGTLLIGTDANQIDIFENDRWRTQPIKILAGGNGVRDIFEESARSLWLATYSGIIHIQDGKETVYSTAQGMPADDFRTILKDRRGNFWFASRSGGLVKFKDGKILEVYHQNNGLESNYVLAVTELANGNIAVGTHSGGMTIISPDGKTNTFHLRKDDAGILLFNIDQDKQGRIWVMANTGPVAFHDDSLRAIALQPDAKGKTYFDFVDDENGNFWITTSVGVMRIEKQNLIDQVEGKPGEIPFQLVDDKDGMNNKECTGATRSLRSVSGKLYIPTLGGVCVINPVNQRRNTIVPTIRISHFLSDTLEHNTYQHNQKIKAGTLRYSFQFSALSFTAPERNRFRYRLEGFDNDWSPMKSEGTVEYTNLPPGTYTFHVIGSNDNNLWNEKGAALRFTVEPFFYQTYWFYGLLIVLISGLLFSIYQWRMRLVQKQNQALQKVNTELDRFVYSASHDLRSPLSSILGLINVARKDENQDKSQYLNMIEKSVVKLDSFIRDIIDFSRNARLEVAVEEIDFAVLLKDIFEDLRFVENYEKIQRTVVIHTAKSFRSDSKRIRVILSNLIANAIKHHFPPQRTNPFVSIEITDDVHGIVITVADNGPGIEEKYLKDIFKMFFRATDRTSGSGLGLYIVEETVARVNGKINVASTWGEGTTFTVKLPDLH